MLQLAQKRAYHETYPQFTFSPPPLSEPGWWSRQWEGVRDFWFRNHLGTRLEGVLQTVGGVGTCVSGVAVAGGGTIFGVGVGAVVTIPVGLGVLVAGADQVITGLWKVWDGEEHASLIAQGVEAVAGEGTGQYYELSVGLIGGSYGVYTIIKYRQMIVTMVKGWWMRVWSKSPTHPSSTAAPHAPLTATAATVRAVASSFDDIVNNPAVLFGKSADEIAAILGDGWTKGKYGVTGTGWKFTKDDKVVFYHEGGRHVGRYWGFSSGTTGKVKVVGKDYKPRPGDKARIIRIEE